MQFISVISVAFPQVPQRSCAYPEFRLRTGGLQIDSDRTQVNGSGSLSNPRTALMMEDD